MRAPVKRADIAALGALQRNELLGDVATLVHRGEWRIGEAVRCLRAVVLGKNRQDSLHASSVSCRPPCSSSRTDPTPTRRWTP